MFVSQVFVSHARPRDAYVRTGPSLVQIKSCRLIGAKPLSDPCWNVNYILRIKLQWNVIDIETEPWLFLTEEGDKVMGKWMWPSKGHFRERKQALGGGLCWFFCSHICPVNGSWPFRCWQIVMTHDILLWRTTDDLVLLFYYYAIFCCRWEI